MDYITGGTELIDEISPLWEMTKQHHISKVSHFREQFESKTFEQRKTELLKKCIDGKMLIVIAKADNKNIGYCLSIAADNKGDIESLYVMPEYRKGGVARTLMEMSMSWLQDAACEEIALTVAVGNEEVLPFYEKLGFYPNLINLVYKN